jgi:hypothetical protein
MSPVRTAAAGPGGGGPAHGAPAPGAFTGWPLPVGRVATVGELTYVYAPGCGGFSAEEFRRIPDGRVELVDGVVLVRPAVTAGQRQVLDELYKALYDRCPAGLVPCNDTLDVQVGAATVFRPDLQVLTEDGDEARSVLVAEIMPGHGRRPGRADRAVKLRGFKDAGVATYWAVDPDEFLVAVYDLQHGRNASPGGEAAPGPGKRYWWQMWAWALPGGDATRAGGVAPVPAGAAGGTGPGPEKDPLCQMAGVDDVEPMGAGDVVDGDPRPP